MSFIKLPHFTSPPQIVLYAVLALIFSKKSNNALCLPLEPEHKGSFFFPNAAP
jgi:hypothetical protein